MTTPVLEPCPGCGETEWLRVVNAGFKTYEVGCAGDDGCGFRGPKISSDDDELAKQGAREAWNTRVAPRRPSPADQRTAREVVRAAFEEAGAAAGTTLFIAMVDMLERDRDDRASRPAALVPGEPRGDESRVAHGR